MSIFFTADTHFRHQNIIKYCNRPFHGTDEMDEKMIREWNRKVDYNDDIYHLGDFGFGPVEKMSDILCRLNGHKYLIRGNHDRVSKNPEFSRYFKWIEDTYLLTVKDDGVKDGNQFIWLSHYAHLVWPQMSYGAWHLFGHSHGTAIPTNLKSFDVGVDCWNFAPIGYDELKHVMRSKTP